MAIDRSTFLEYKRNKKKYLTAGHAYDRMLFDKAIEALGYFDLNPNERECLADAWSCYQNIHQRKGVRNIRNSFIDDIGATVVYNSLSNIEINTIDDFAKEYILFRKQNMFLGDKSLGTFLSVYLEAKLRGLSLNEFFSELENIRDLEIESGDFTERICLNAFDRYEYTREQYQRAERESVEYRHETEYVLKKFLEDMKKDILSAPDFHKRDIETEIKYMASPSKISNNDNFKMPFNTFRKILEENIHNARQKNLSTLSNFENMLCEIDLTLENMQIVSKEEYSMRNLSEFTTDGNVLLPMIYVTYLLDSVDITSYMRLLNEAIKKYPDIVDFRLAKRLILLNRKIVS